MMIVPGSSFFIFSTGEFTGKMLLCRVFMGNCYKPSEGCLNKSFKPPCIMLEKCALFFKDGACTDHVAYDSALLKKNVTVNCVQHVYEKILIRDSNLCCPLMLIEYETVVNPPKQCFI